MNRHIAKLTEFIEPSEKVNSAIVAKNQTILLNREMDEPVASLLSLELKRRPAGCLAPDVAVNEQRCKMFTTVYRFLAALASGNKQAQEKLHPLVSVFLDHEGIEGLPVSPTIAGVFKNNPTLLSQVSRPPLLLLLSPGSLGDVPRPLFKSLHPDSALPIQDPPPSTRHQPHPKPWILRPLPSRDLQPPIPKHRLPIRDPKPQTPKHRLPTPNPQLPNLASHLETPQP